MPARVSVSVHGWCPGDLGMRFCTWQALVAEPLLTYNAPRASMANGCMGWSPVRGSPDPITVGASVGTIPVADKAYLPTSPATPPDSPPPQGRTPGPPAPPGAHPS